MIRLNVSIKLAYDVVGGPGDCIFNIHAAQTARQRVVTESLHVTGCEQPGVDLDATSGCRFVRLRVPRGPLTVNYTATVDIDHFVEQPENLREVPINDLPLAALHYIYPSRYCQSDKLRQFAGREFGHIAPGYSRIKAIEDWVYSRTTFRSGTSDDSTSALDTLLEQAGVCRDFAHLMIALCRAISIPARFATGIDYDSPPELGPPDFHAYVEVFLSGRWYIFDPSRLSPPMGLMRIGTGRDAADVSFATLFGSIQPVRPVVTIDAVDDPSQGFIRPYPCAEALSTHDS
ncbi:MAG TPA: transglutaminase family protein [Spongiibacteraceae bacterium]|nr:transglutaminase family protein [Spongiibacteraceae bacterium]